MAGIGAFGGVLAATAAAVTLANPGLDRGPFFAALSASTVLVLVGVGLFAWRRSGSERFGRLLVAAGFAASVVALSASNNEVLYSVGRTAGWGFEVLLVYLFLSFPSGRLTLRADRILFAASAVTVLVLYAPSALLVEQFPLPWLICSENCPPNGFQLAGAEPGFVDTVLTPTRTVVTIGVYAALLLLLVTHIARATAPMRRGLTPVVAAMAFRASMAVCFLVAREFDANQALTDPLGSLVLLSAPLAAFGFLVGLMRWQLHSAIGLQRLAASPEPVDAPEMRGRLAEAVGDPSLELYLPAPGVAGMWSDAGGEPASLPASGERCVIDVVDDGERIAVIACDPALEDHRDLVAAAGAWLRAVLIRRRLTIAVRLSLREVEESRRRLATAAAGERRRIERDLHDGAQQQLVALRVKLQLAEEELERDPAGGARLVHDLAPRVDDVIDEVRSLARGIYPPLLADAGIGEAVRAAALRAELPVTVEFDGLGRYALEVENAVYFCCLEALQNAAKHGYASTVAVEFSDHQGTLRFEVRDDGRGFSPNGGGPVANGGAGLTNMRDRLTAVGGSLVVRSAPGAGTAVIGRVPAADK